MIFNSMQKKFKGNLKVKLYGKRLYHTGKSYLHIF